MLILPQCKITVHIHFNVSIACVTALSLACMHNTATYSMKYFSLLSVYAISQLAGSGPRFFGMLAGGPAQPPPSTEEAEVEGIIPSLLYPREAGERE